MTRALVFARVLTSAFPGSSGQVATPAKYPRVVTELRLGTQTETIPTTTFFTTLLVKLCRRLQLSENV